MTELINQADPFVLSIIIFLTAFELLQFISTKLFRMALSSNALYFSGLAGFLLVDERSYIFPTMLVGIGVLYGITRMYVLMNNWNAEHYLLK